MSSVMTYCEYAKAKASYCRKYFHSALLRLYSFLLKQIFISMYIDISKLQTLLWIVS